MPPDRVRPPSIARRVERLRLIERDRLVPIELPLDQQAIDLCVGVDNDDAWMPLAVGIVQRLQRLWGLVCGGSPWCGRVTNDEYLYQVLRVSLNNLVDGQLLSETLYEDLESLPDTLPSRNDLDDHHSGGSWAVGDRLEQLELGLVREAVRLHLSPDARTVEDVLTHYDAFLARLELDAFREALASDRLHHEHLAYATAQVKERERLLRFDAHADLAIAAALVDRIIEFWEFVFGDATAMERHDGDEACYQSWRNLLLQCLDAPAYALVHDLASTTCPALLPDDLDLMLDAETIASHTSHLRRLKYEIIALATRLGKSVLFDDDGTINIDARYPAEARQWTAFRKTVLRKASTPVTIHAGTRSQGSRGGRPPVEITWNDANRLWWEMSDEYAPKKPTYKEFCERLSMMGESISERTLLERRKNWREQGLKFPGPRPESDAETA